MKKSNELSEDELRDLLMQKKNAGREARIASYRASGRVIDPDDAPILTEKEDEKQTGKKPEPSKTRARHRLDTFLLIVEITAVIGIIFLLGKSTDILNTLNREAAKAFVMPTLTPTALIRAVVLPSGHIAPDALGNTAFNDYEVPEHLRSLVLLNATPVPVPQTPETPVRIRIPAINVDAPIVRGDDWESLKNGVGLNAGSTEPGKPGNLILSGHNDIFGEVFRDLDKLNENDEIFILTEKDTYTYVVGSSRIVSPTQVDVMNQTGSASLTLISCYPYMVDNKRIVISARLQQ